MDSNGVLSGLDDDAAGSEAWFREQLRTLVELPTVSPGVTDDREIRAGALAAREIFESIGAEAELVETRGTPCVLARLRHPQARAKLVVYNHLDVQPASGPAWLQSDPFHFEVEKHDKRGFLYRGRGATDDKGPALCAVRAAKLAIDRGVPIDVTFVWETEEEIGSPHFGEVIAARREQLDCEAVIVSDTIWPTDEQPAVSTGLRGSLYATLRLRTAGKESHSGLVGGVARNPIRELCKLASAIDGASFWQAGVLVPSEDEIASFLKSGFDTDYFKHAYDLHHMTTEVPLEIMLKVWTRPTFEVHGMVGGYTGPGIKTIIPDAAELKISFRLVPDQDPRVLADALCEFVRHYNPDVTCEVSGWLAPFRAPTSGRVHEAIVGALHHTTGRCPVTVREGGSIGAVPVIARELGVPVHFLPLSLPDHGYHAPNEYFDWRQARIGIAAFARTFATVAAGGGGEP
ncbi:MAG: M20/M25/M40 family metallo-hydrolase [Deltaproteobacteria bacterium]|nr:M20/M25/M40 family metallo-hydrolase [Nannocystaceae bacterium]